MQFKDFLSENRQDKNSVLEFLTGALNLDQEDFNINEDLSVSLFVDLDISNNSASSLRRIPVKFREIQGSVWISNCKLETLIGLPAKIDGGVYITNARITNLRYCPQQLGDDGDIVLQNNRELVSLEGCPSDVPQDFSLNDCHKITSLEGGPKTVGHNYKVDTCDGLTSIKGMPTKIGKHLALCNNRNLTSLAGISKMLKECGGKLDVSGSRFTSSIMGLLVIKGFTGIEYKFGGAEATKAFEIIFNCRKDGKDALDCQEALFDAGLDEFAHI